MNHNDRLRKLAGLEQLNEAKKHPYMKDLEKVEKILDKISSNKKDIDRELLSTQFRDKYESIRDYINVTLDYIDLIK